VCVDPALTHENVSLLTDAQVVRLETNGNAREVSKVIVKRSGSTFYRDVLGMRIAGESENYGTEQEHLNNVFGARLHITSMHATGGGPGIEFLEYLAPRNGRTVPADERPSDVIHWQTTLTVGNAEAVAVDLRANRTTFVSPGLVRLGRDDLGFTKALLVRDPDGHVMELVEK
jgi:catechol 2,3-dioxygenase-like lactoylglutathione lyase family enzyme